MKFFTRREMNKAIKAIETDKETDAMKDERREALRRLGLISATGAFFYACGSSSDDNAVASTVCESEIKANAETELFKNKKNDIDLMNAALGLEQEAVVTYTTAASLSDIWLEETLRTAPTYLEIAGAFRGHHAEHAAVLARYIKEAGGTPVTPKTFAEYQAAFAAADKLDLPATPAGKLVNVLKYAMKKELGAAQAYASLVPKLKIAEHQGAFANNAADEAAHYAVFRAAFLFVNPEVITDDTTGKYKALAAKNIIPGATPDQWPKL